MKEETFDFDKDFDFDEEELFCIDELAQDITGDESGISVIVPERAGHIMSAYKALRRIVRGKNVGITYEFNAPYTSMGSVSVVGREIEITNPALFAKVAEISSNFEIYPKTNGTVQMNFTFHNLTRKVGD